MLRHELQLNEISVVIEFSEEGSLVRVVPGQLQQVILNLIKNAIETISYIPPSRRRLSISTRLEEDRQLSICLGRRNWSASSRPRLHI